MEHQAASLESVEPTAVGNAPSWWSFLNRNAALPLLGNGLFSQTSTVALAGAILLGGLIDTATAQQTGTNSSMAPGALATGFEPQEGYSLGNLNNQNGWQVDRGAAEVWSNQVYSGAQAVRIAPDSQISHSIATASPLVTFDGYLQAVPSSAPEIPVTAQLAVLYLDQNGGITGLDGDGNGGGSWVGSGVAVAPGTWFRVTIGLNFTARTWSCAVNGVETLSNLHFHSNHVAVFSTVTVSAQTGNTLLDQVTVGVENPPLSLAIRKLGPEVELTWPMSASGYRLQTSTNLSPGSWLDVPTSDNRLIQAIDQPSKFFRLTGP